MAGRIAHLRTPCPPQQVGDCVANSSLDEAAAPRGRRFVGIVWVIAVSGALRVWRVIRLDFRPMWLEFVCLEKRVSRDVRIEKPNDPGHEARRVGRRDRAGVSSGGSPVGVVGKLARVISGNLI